MAVSILQSIDPISQARGIRDIHDQTTTWFSGAGNEGMAGQHPSKFVRIPIA